MFLPFRQQQKRKVNNHSSGGHNDQPASNGSTPPILPLKLFMQQDEPKQNKQPQQPNMWADNSSVDLSVYTTESKTTVQYPPRDPYGHMDSTEAWSIRDVAKATTRVAQESTLLEPKNDERNPSLSPKTATGTKLNEWMLNEWMEMNEDRSSSPSTAPSTPPRHLEDHPEDEEEEVEDYSSYYDVDYQIQDQRQNSVASGKLSMHSSNDRATHSRGPVDLDDSSVDDDDDDDDDVVVDKRRDTKVLNASVFRPKPTQILSEDSDNEGRNSPIVWADHDHDDDGITELAPPPRKLSHEDAAALNRSYNETMQAISFLSIDKNKKYNGFGDEDDCYNSDDIDSGAVLLTQEELAKHLSKVQNKEPMPSSYIGGYDQWKREQEYKRLYFEKLQRKVNEKKHVQQYQHPAQFYGTRIQSSDDSLADFTTFTTGQMDKSVASTIATVQTREASVRHEPDSKTGAKQKSKRKWMILPKLTGSSKKKPDKVQARHASPPRQASLNRVEDLSEVANLSLAPLNTVLGMDVGSHGEPSQLVSLHLQEERKKQMQAEKEKELQEWKEQQRILRRKEQYLQQQRKLNNIDPSAPRSHSPTPSADFTNPSRLGSASFVSEISGSKRSTILSPCIICDDAERTHVAMPCMHFYFCGGCAKKLQTTEHCQCPVCGATKVNFARVYTG